VGRLTAGHWRASIRVSGRARTEADQVTASLDVRSVTDGVLKCDIRSGAPKGCRDDSRAFEHRCATHAAEERDPGRVVAPHHTTTLPLVPNIVSTSVPAETVVLGAEPTSKVPEPPKMRSLLPYATTVSAPAPAMTVSLTPLDMMKLDIVSVGSPAPSRLPPPPPPIVPPPDVRIEDLLGR
jgi:hypothetical protein